MLAIGLGFVAWRLTAFSSLLPAEEVTKESLQFLLEGIQLFNNVTTFSLLSFLDHFLSHPTATPLPNLFWIPVFAFKYPEIESLRHFYVLCGALVGLFLLIWLYEAKREGILLKSKALRVSLFFYMGSLLAEKIFGRDGLVGVCTLVVVQVATLYLFRFRAAYDHHSSSKIQASSARNFSIALFLLFLTDFKVALIGFLIFLIYELNQTEIEQKKKITAALKILVNWRHQSISSILIGLCFVLLLMEIASPGMIGIEVYWLMQNLFLFICLRCLTLYQKNFVHLIHFSWNYRQIGYYFLLPLACWMIYPMPNRFEVYANPLPKASDSKVKVEERELLREVLLPVLASDRRIKVFGITKEDPRCLLMEFEMRRSYPDWSRNPEPVLCPDTLEKIDAKELEALYHKGLLGTILAFHTKASNLSFEIPLFIRNANLNSERVTISLKEWGVLGTIFYLSDNDT